jgi:hypothetical protein
MFCCWQNAPSISARRGGCNDPFRRYISRRRTGNSPPDHPGFNGSTFTLREFRSIMSDAGQRMREEAHPNLKRNCSIECSDLRLTPVGKVAPEIFNRRPPPTVNVLKGRYVLWRPAACSSERSGAMQILASLPSADTSGLTVPWALLAEVEVIFQQASGALCHHEPVRLY